LNKFLIKYMKLLQVDEKIELLVNRKDLSDFYEEIDCLIIPAEYEAFGLSALEVMSRGKIVLLSSRCGAKDIIEHDNNGFIFDITKNPTRNLTRILKYIITNKNDFENMRQKAIFTASVYNFDKFKTELIRIIEKFLPNQKES